MCLSFRRTTEDIVRYYDSDYGGDFDNNKINFELHFRSSGTIVNWQACFREVTMSFIIEVEYMATTEAFKDVKWLNGLVKEFS